MSEQVPEEIKLERLNRLQRLQNRISSEINLGMVGKELPILVEGKSKKDPGRLTGRTRTNRVVNCKGASKLIGEICMVEITKAKPFDLEGEIKREVKT